MIVPDARTPAYPHASVPLFPRILGLKWIMSAVGDSELLARDAPRHAVKMPEVRTLDSNISVNSSFYNS